MRIGLTGPIGAGKSLVAAVWKEMGADVVEGDAMGRLAITEPTVRDELSARFGSDILDAAGRIVPTRLAAVAFKSNESSRELTRITFPALYRHARRHFARLEKRCPAVVFDAALIFEWGVAGDFDEIVAVTAPENVLLKRVSERLGISADAAAARLRVQLDQAEKARRADYVIVNDGDIAALEAEAGRIWNKIVSGSPEVRQN